MVKILLKVPLSNTQDFDTSAIVLYMNYAKHRFSYQTVKLSKITSSFYSNIFTFTRFSATRFKIKQCYKPKLFKKFNNISRSFSWKVKRVFDKKIKHQVKHERQKKINFKNPFFKNHNEMKILISKQCYTDVFFVLLFYKSNFLECFE